VFITRSRLADFYSSGCVSWLFTQRLLVDIELLIRL